jgi:hypothetical protein
LESLAADFPGVEATSQNIEKEPSAESTLHRQQHEKTISKIFRRNEVPLLFFRFRRYPMRV